MCRKWFANREDILKLFGVRWQRLACQVMLMVFTASCHVGSSPKTIAGTTIKVGVAGVVVFVPYSLCMPQWNDKTMIKKTCAHWPPTSGSYTTICCNSSVHVTYFRTYIHNFLCCHILAKKKVPMTYGVTHIKLKYQHHQPVTTHYLQIITHIKKFQNTLWTHLRTMSKQELKLN